MTSYDEIYKRFLNKISDYELPEYDEKTASDFLEGLLIASIEDFSPICKQELVYDSGIEEISATLTGLEKEILALGMVVHWIQPRIINTDVLRNALNTKDFSMYSPANLLEKMQKIHESTAVVLDRKIKMYSYRNEDISSLTE